jgi:adenylate cyclase
MEQLAEPGTACLTEHTAALAEGYVELADLGTFDIKGTQRPVLVHELRGIGTARGWLDIARTRGLSGFVGREEELATLDSAMDRALAGQGQVIGIVGEAGVGKSRLCDEFIDRIRLRRPSVSHVVGQAHARSVPLIPLLQSVRSYFGITEDDADDLARSRITAGVLALDADLLDDLPLLFDFLGLPDPQRPSPRMDPDARQRRLLTLLKHLTQARSRREPGVFVFEDLHWLDAASETFLANLVEAIQGTRSLVVINFRPEYQAPWMARSFYRQLPLAPLDEAAVDALLDDLLGDDPSLEGLTGLISERTQGNPFFIEESVRALVETGDLTGERGAHRLVGAVHDIRVPASVHAVLSARIDRLPPREKGVLQTASVIGKDFDDGVLSHVAGLGREGLDGALRALVAGEFIVERGQFPQTRYAFKHPLTQEVAYASQLAERRGAVHAAVAEAVIALHPGRLDERAALLAEHWEAAQEPLEAALWHARAATWAGTTDPASAVDHALRAGALADAAPTSAQALELGLTARLFSLEYGWRTGISSDEAREIFDAAQRVAADIPDVRPRATLYAIYALIKGLNDGRLGEGVALARQALAVAEASDDPGFHVAIAPIAYVFLATGDYDEGLAICDRALRLADGDVTAGGGVLIACPVALCTIFRGAFLLDMGQLDAAADQLAQGREIAREQGDPETVGLSHSLSVRLAYFRGDAPAALAHARQALDIAQRIGSPQSRARAWLSQGLAEHLSGHWTAAIEALERSRSLADEHRAGVDVDGWRLALLAEAYLGSGDVDRARGTASDGLRAARAQGGCFSEIYASLAVARVALATGGPQAPTEIEATLLRARSLVQRTGARTFAPMIDAELAALAMRARPAP